MVKTPVSRVQIVQVVIIVRVMDLKISKLQCVCQDITRHPTQTTVETLVVLCVDLVMHAPETTTVTALTNATGVKEYTSKHWEIPTRGLNVRLVSLSIIVLAIRPDMHAGYALQAKLREVIALPRETVNA